MKVHVLTLFPRLFENFLQESIVGIAREKGHLQVELTDWRDAATKLVAVAMRTAAIRQLRTPVS